MNDKQRGLSEMLEQMAGSVFDEMLDAWMNGPTTTHTGLGALLVPKPIPTRIAPAVAAQHTMRAQAILALGDTPKHQDLALKHLEAAFVARHPGLVR